jgi:hypothetical protein
LGYANTTFAYPAVDSSSFTFTKTATADGGPWVTEASCTGEPFPAEEFPPLFPVGVRPPAERGDRGDLGVDGMNMITLNPNPFNPSTVACFELPVPSQVSLNIYDTAGRLIATLVDGWRDAGTHSATFDGSKLPSGIYLARLETEEYTSVQKLVLLK